MLVERDPSGRVVRGIGVVSDITEQKRNEAATAAARDAARDAAQEAARTIEAAYGPGQLDPRPAAGPVKGYWMSVRRGGAAGWQGV